MCPSAPADAVGGVVIGAASSEGVIFLGKPVLMTPGLLADARRTDLPAEAVLRVAAPCAAAGCQHFSQNRCSLVTRVVEQLPRGRGTLPPCGIRHDCVWYDQERGEACRRCPKVSTWYADLSDELVGVAVERAGAGRSPQPERPSTVNRD